ncbi:MAG: hypothetical protein SGI88_20495, partial [Candidatus Hydrogenedentes bacterium]|nr:hypothetical protein [Candidatus Hydrogenedentota bacterium]
MNGVDRKDWSGQPARTIATPNTWSTLSMLGCAVVIAATVSIVLMQRHLAAHAVAADALVQRTPHIA